MKNKHKFSKRQRSSAAINILRELVAAKYFNQSLFMHCVKIQEMLMQLCYAKKFVN